MAVVRTNTEILHGQSLPSPQARIYSTWKSLSLHTHIAILLSNVQKPCFLAIAKGDCGSRKLNRQRLNNLPDVAR
jgi:hypothetical protein